MSSSLREKLRPISPARLAAMEKAADAAIASMAKDFASLAKSSVSDLTALIARPDPANDWVERSYVIAHDLKGQAGTFEYNLITEIASSLCRLLRLGQHDDNRAQKLALAHCEAMRSVLEQEIKGSGGEAGRQLLALLGIAPTQP